MTEPFTNTDSYILELDYVHGLTEMFLAEPSGYFKLNGVRIAFFRREGQVPLSIDFIFHHRILNIKKDEIIDDREKVFKKIFETAIEVYRAMRHAGLSFTSDL